MGGNSGAIRDASCGVPCKTRAKPALQPREGCNLQAQEVLFRQKIGAVDLRQPVEERRHIPGQLRHAAVWFDRGFIHI